METMNENAVFGAFTFPDPEVWYQVSRHARLVARLPAGKTGIEALVDAERLDPSRRTDYERWAQRMGEGSAGDYFLRCHASRAANFCDLCQELTRVEFAAFRAAGGTTYAAKHYERTCAKLVALEGLDRDQAGAAILEYVDAAFAKPDSQIDLAEVRDVLRLLAKRRRGEP